MRDDNLLSLLNTIYSDILPVNLLLWQATHRFHTPQHVFLMLQVHGCTKESIASLVSDFSGDFSGFITEFLEIYYTKPVHSRLECFEFFKHWILFPSSMVSNYWNTILTIFSPQTIYYRLVYPYHFNNCTALIQVMQENKCPIRKFYVVSRGKTLFCFTYLKVKSRGASLSTRKFGVWLCTLWMQTFTEVCSTSDYETGAKLTCNRIHFFLCWIKTNFLCCGEGGESLCKQIAIPKSPAYRIEWLVLTKR